MATRTDTTCVKCDKDSEYDSPDILCQYHWTEWWCEGVYEGTWSTLSQEERDKLIQKHIDEINTPMTPEELKESMEYFGIESKEEAS